MEVFGKIMAVLLLLVIGAVGNAFVVSMMWNQLIVPIFGVQLLSMGQAFALSVFITYFLMKDNNSQKEQKTFTDVILEGVGKMIANVSIALLMTWVASYFV